MIRLELTVDEARVLRGAALMYQAHTAVRKDFARREDPDGVEHWTDRHDLTRALADRIDAAISEATSAAGQTSRPVEVAPEPAAETGSGAPFHQPPAGTDTPAGGQGPRTVACDSCGAPLRLERVGALSMCSPCRDEFYGAQR